MLVILWVAAIVVGTAVGAGRGHALAGFFLSLFLAWFGVLIVLFMPKPTQPTITNIHNEINER